MRCANLPEQLSAFIGREREIAAATRLLRDTRLLTLTGAGGSGKTRLALAVAEPHVRRYGDGVWFVDLAALEDPDLAPQAVADALNLRAAPGRPVIDALTSYLRTRNVLLVLDNCEHMVEACARLAFALLTAAPRLRILATSREPLRVTGETTWVVPPLALPEPAALPELEKLARIDSIRLFVERAGRIAPGFTLDERNALPISRICHRLGGSPLAIELTAARIRVLSPAQIADRLEETLNLPATDSRTVPPRHRTLQATLDWSYNLLNRDEQALFRRLSVFPSSFSIDAAEAVGGSGERGATILELLIGLVDKSLIEVEAEAGPERRFRYLEPVRQYAAEKVAGSGEEPDARNRLLDWAAAFADEVGPGAFTRAARESAERLELEHANLRAALAWSLSAAGDVVAGSRLANALAQFWQNRGYIAEGVGWFEQLLSKREAMPAATQAVTLMNAAFLLIHARDTVQARRRLEQGIRLAGELGNRQLVAYCYHHLCFLALNERNLDEAKRLCELTLRMFEEIDDAWGRAIVHFYLANIYCLEQDYRKAREAAERSAEICRAIGYIPALARRQIRLGQILRAEGDLPAARASIVEGLRTGREIGDIWCAAMGLAALAGLTLQEGQPTRAAWLIGVTQCFRDTFGVPLWLVDEIEYERNRSDLETRLGPRAFAEASAAGAKEAARDMQAALRKALGEPAQAKAEKVQAAPPSPLPASVPAVSAPLSRREREVAALIAQGKSNAEIAAALFVGLRTVEAHVTHILNKLGFNSRAQIAAWVSAQSASASSPAPDRKRSSR